MVNIFFAICGSIGRLCFAHDSNLAQNPIYEIEMYLHLAFCILFIFKFFIITFEVIKGSIFCGFITFYFDMNIKYYINPRTYKQIHTPGEGGWMEPLRRVFNDFTSGGKPFIFSTR